MKRRVLLAIVGAAALTGCQTEVMKQRGYVPAQDDPVSARQAQVRGAEAPQDMQQMPGAEQQSAPAAQPARGGAAEFPTMTGTFSNDGFDSTSDAAARGGAAAAAGEYVVKSGDTLGKIAAKHHVRLSALMKANNLTDKDAKRLRVGRKLVIPARDGKAAGKAARAGRKGGKSFGAKNGKNAGDAKSGKGGKASIQAGEYIVKSGDTPEKIARRAKVRLSALMEANNLTEKEARSLRIGQKLVIPARDGKAAAKPGKKGAKKSAEQPVEQKAKPQEAAPADDLEREMNREAAGQPATAAAPAKASDAAPAAPAKASDAAPAKAPAAAPAGDQTVGDGWVMVSKPVSIDAFAKQHKTTVEALRRENSELTGDTIPGGYVVILPR